MGRELPDTHIGFDIAEPYSLERMDQSLPARLEDKTILSADNRRDAIVLDSKTALTWIPGLDWEYRRGNPHRWSGP